MSGWRRVRRAVCVVSVWGGVQAGGSVGVQRGDAGGDAPVGGGQGGGAGGRGGNAGNGGSGGLGVTDAASEPFQGDAGPIVSDVNATVDTGNRHQVMVGFGGNIVYYAGLLAAR